MAIHARQLALEPDLQIIRRSRRPLLPGLEQARRSALAHHVHRIAPMGARVLINGIRYKGRLIAILLTGGEAHDCPVAKRLIRRAKPPKRMLGDKAYDSTELREELNERGTKPIIPNKSNRKQPFSFSKRLYKLRWRIESAFNRLKDFRRIATRYDRLARNYLASVCLAAALVWWI